MSGKYLLDTNALIYAINRKLKLPSADYAVSVITKMELLSWPQLSPSEELQLRAALSGIQVLQLSETIQEAAIKIRKTTSMKLPDSIIAATAIDGGYVLVTDDEKLRNRHVGKSLKLDELLGEF
ncbi:MAG: type II toxin-antitoxin system VapC family toxin [Nitrincola sp.]|nr:type II toxin-antitoxin system VapC family toxin [Nitrincola sp.]